MIRQNIRKKLTIKKLKLFLGFVIISVFLMNVMMVATAEMLTPKPAPVAVLYDPMDTTLTNTATSIANYVAGFTAVKMIPVFQAKDLLTLIAGISNPIVYVFHGNTYGWKVGNDFVANTILSSDIKKSPSPANFFVVCDSDVLAQTISNKYIGNLFGITDAQVGLVLIEQQLLSYYSTRGLTQLQYTQSNSNLQTYIQKNGMNLFSRLYHPVQPLYYCTFYSEEYSSSNDGPSRFDITSTSSPSTPETQAFQNAVAAIQQLVSLLNKIPGLTLSINIAYKTITGNAIYTWGVPFSCTPVGEGVEMMYSSVDYGISFNYVQFSTSVSYAAEGSDPGTEGHSFSVSALGVSLDLTIDPGVPSLSTGGNLGYTSDVAYTVSPSNGNYQSVVNTWIYSNIPAGWEVNLYFQLGNTYGVSGSATYDGNTLEVDIGSILLAGRVTFSIDTSGNVVVGGSIFATAHIDPSLTFPIVGTIVGVDLKFLVVGLGVEGQWTSGIFTSVSYFGVDFAGTFTILNNSAGYSFIWTYPYQNDISGLSTDTLISQLFTTEFGG